MQAQTTQTPIPAMNHGHRFIGSPPAAIVRLGGAGVNGVLATGESAYNRVHKRKQRRSRETHKQYSQHHGN